MDYKLMQPPFEMKEYSEMNKKEAKEHFDWFKQQIPSRLEQLGAFSQIHLDYSDRSLIDIWDWYLANVQIQNKSTSELKEEYSKSSKWMKEYINDKKVSTQSKAFTLDIGIYLGEVVKSNHSGLDWGIIFKPKSYISVNRPVITGLTRQKDMDVIMIVTNEMYLVLDGERNPNALFDIYQTWEKYI
ncbi:MULTISPECIES: hypothetical protein [Paenibacillus]|uniref:Uncharacterized protein n=1 Tax=Paenibacillus polymyxa TaxID=1406 RepID=A0AAP4E8B7_PAEPO|nr:MULTISPECIES: hypothetical protein [Paenibacillus]MCP3744528.1 hypothetical protein [Paenibacillus sp. A3M_27_13]MDH2330047.1 hypothetical protein [Paenibacillus polymyxa]ODB59648.1 hypothetical protein A7309_19905 [Paenibacillus polymyxa]